MIDCRSRRWVTGLTVGLALLTGGCARPTGEADVAPPVKQADPGRKLRFAMVPKQLDNPVFGYARRAAEQRAAELGVDLLWDAPTSNDEAKQAEIVDTFVEQGVDGIAISCINPAVMKRAIDRAVDVGIPVTTWDSDCPDSKRAAFYGLNDLATGRILAEEMVALLPDGGDVAILSGVRGAANLEERLRGVNEVLAGQPALRVVSTVYCDDDLSKSVQLVGDIMTRYPDLAGWIMVGGWPLFAKSGLAAVTPQRTKVVAVDPLPEAWHWLTSGHVQVCVAQKYFGWGAESLNLLHALARGEAIEVGPGGLVDSGTDLVVPEATGRYAEPRYILLADYQTRFDSFAGPAN